MQMEKGINVNAPYSKALFSSLPEKITNIRKENREEKAAWRDNICLSFVSTVRAIYCCSILLV